MAIIIIKNMFGKFHGHNGSFSASASTMEFIYSWQNLGVYKFMEETGNGYQQPAQWRYIIKRICILFAGWSEGFNSLLGKEKEFFIYVMENFNQIITNFENKILEWGIRRWVILIFLDERNVSMITDESIRIQHFHFSRKL